MGAAAADIMTDNLHFRPLTASHQDVIWQLLAFAAHENSVQDVKSQECCVPYAQDFGTTGDLGVLATTSNDSDDQEPTVVGGAWIRLLGEEGTSKVTSNDENDEVPELALAVFPEYRGRGFGSKILQALLEMAKQQGVASICLSCRVDNVAAMRLYERHGFVRIPNSEVTNRVGGTNVSMKIKLV